MSVSLLLFCRQVYLCHILDFMGKYHSQSLFVPLCLWSLPVPSKSFTISSGNYPSAFCHYRYFIHKKCFNFLNIDINGIIQCIYTLFYLVCLTQYNGFDGLPKKLPANAGDVRDVNSIPGSGRSPGGGHVNPLQYSCLGNPMDRGVWWATVHRVTNNWTRMKWFSSQTKALIFIQVIKGRSSLLFYWWSEVKWKVLSCVRLFATPCMEFSRPESWSG